MRSSAHISTRQAIRESLPNRLVIDLTSGIVTKLMRTLLLILVLTSGLACEKTIREANGREDASSDDRVYTIAVVRSTAAASGLA